MTAHINASINDFAETTIMPGDPLRAKYIAKKYLTNFKEITNVRNMLGYTGYYQNERITVMGHGMGIPSITLYAHELIHDFNVKRIIRIGSLGATQSYINMRDIIIALAAGTDSMTNTKRCGGYHMATSAYFPLLLESWNQAKKKNFSVHVGNVFSGDLYYDPDELLIPALEKFGVLGIDMEVAGLYGIAQQEGIEALAILTVSDHCLSGEETTAEERQETFDQMIELALNTAVSRQQATR